MEAIPVLVMTSGVFVFCAQTGILAKKGLMNRINNNIAGNFFTISYLKKQ